MAFRPNAVRMQEPRYRHQAYGNEGQAADEAGNARPRTASCGVTTRRAPRSQSIHWGTKTFSGRHPTPTHGELSAIVDHIDNGCAGGGPKGTPPSPATPAVLEAYRN